MVAETLLRAAIFSRMNSTTNMPDRNDSEKTAALPVDSKEGDKVRDGSDRN